MVLTNEMTVIEATERSKIEIPVSQLLAGGGALQIRPDLIGKGLVEVRQSYDTLKLQINGVVGRLPLTDDILVDIKPKFPISNLNRIVYASGKNVSDPFSISRLYKDLEEVEYLPVPLIRTFTKRLQRVTSQGTLRQYRRETSDTSPKPKVNFIKSQQRYWSKLIPTMAVVENFSFDQDNLANQCLKAAAIKALSISRGADQLYECRAGLAQSLRQMERIGRRTPSEILSQIASGRHGVPAHREDYHAALACAVQILRHVDVSLDVTSQGLALDSYIISLDDVFEAYIRNVLLNLPDVGFGRIATLDGNRRRHQRKLFADNRRFDVKPDLIIRDERGPVLIGDVKYKIKGSEEDRYQIIAHSLSYNVRKAVLIYPKPEKQVHSGLIRLGMIGPAAARLHIFEYFFDLSGNLQDQEQELRSVIKSLASP